MPYTTDDIYIYIYKDDLKRDSKKLKACSCIRNNRNKYVIRTTLFEDEEVFIKNTEV